jgi:hypothetical protein
VDLSVGEKIGRRSADWDRRSPAYQSVWMRVGGFSARARVSLMCTAGPLPQRRPLANGRPGNRLRCAAGCPLGAAAGHWPYRRLGATRGAGGAARPRPARPDIRAAPTQTSPNWSSCATSRHAVRKAGSSCEGYGSESGLSSGWDRGAELSTTDQRSTHTRMKKRNRQLAHPESIWHGCACRTLRHAATRLTTGHIKLG